MTHFLVDLGDLLALVVQEQETHQILIISLGKRVGQQDFAADTNGIKIPLFFYVNNSFICLFIPILT